MIDLRARADALSRMLQNPNPQSQEVEALLAFCRELVFAAEPNLALELLERVPRAHPMATRVLAIRCDALNRAGRYSESFELVGELLQIPKLALSAEGTRLRLLQGSNLWRLNRIPEAREMLLAVRRELVILPDSEMLAD